MDNRYTDGVKQALQFAAEEAVKLGSEALDTEHLLLGIAREKDGAGGKILQAVGVTAEAIEPLLDGLYQRSFFGGGQRVHTSPRTKRVLQMAVEEANEMGNNYVGTEHLLLALLREGGLAVQVLQHLGVTQEKLQKAFETVLSEDSSKEARTAVSVIFLILLSI